MTRAKKAPTENTEVVQITPIDMRTVTCQIVGTTPYVQHRFSAKAKAKIRETHERGGQAKSRKSREPRDFEADYEAATHRDGKGKCGIPASAFRSAMIDVCRAAGFMMTRAKIAVFVKADALDAEDQTPLVHFVSGDRTKYEATVRNETGVVDLRVRPLWFEGWSANVRLEFDAGMLSANDVVNLLDRAGAQIGIGEGRPFSKSSNGTGFGLFRVAKVFEGEVAA